MKGLILLLIVIGFVCLVTPLNPCLREGLCYCEKPDGNIIDLRPLTNVALHTYDKMGQFSFDANMCNPLNLPFAGCNNSNICQTVLGTNNHYILGFPGNFRFRFLGIHLGVEYVANDRRTTFRLECVNNTNSAIEYVSENPVKVYHFVLKSNYACERKNSTNTISV